MKKLAVNGLNAHTRKRLRDKNPGAYLKPIRRQSNCDHCDQYRKGYDAGYLAGRKAGYR